MPDQTKQITTTTSQASLEIASASYLQIGGSSSMLLCDELGSVETAAESSKKPKGESEGSDIYPKEVARDQDEGEPEAKRQKYSHPPFSR